MTSNMFPKILFWIFKLLVEIAYIPIFVIRLFKRAKKCPPVKDDILLLSAATLAERIRTRQITSEAVIRAYISRIEEINPLLNAVIYDRFAEAVEEAKQVDDLVANSGLSPDKLREKYPLLGVPLTVKGSIAVAGLNNTAGRVDRTTKAEIDAISVKRARDAGAIPILTSNVPELCLSWETTNKLIGTTRNPYNTTRIAGGSSGGEASLVGGAASIMGIGSDIAGSLRLPAHCCGVWGHKPSPHTVSSKGHYPDCKNKDDWLAVFALGPVTRYANDLRLLFSVIVEPEMGHLLKLNHQVDVKKLKFYYLEDVGANLSKGVNNSVSKALKKVVAHFDRICDNKCSELNVPLLDYCTELSYLRLLFIDDVENLFEGRGEGAYKELFKFLSGQSKHEFLSISYGLLRRNIHLLPKETKSEINKHIATLKNDFIKVLGDDGVFICPTFPSEAYYHGDIFRQLFNSGVLSIFNSLGFPATSCPIGFSKNGLPIGIQVVAAPNFDRYNLAVAEELERAFGGWKPPEYSHSNIIY